MSDSGSGQRDDRGGQPDGDGEPGRDDDYTPSASWESSRGSSWQNTTPYESPYAGPGSAGSAGSYGSPSSSDPGSSAASAGSAAERPSDSGPWPSYSDQGQPGGEQPGYQQPGYQQQPYPPQVYGQEPYEQGYEQQQPYGQSYEQQQPYGQSYGQQPAYGVNPYQQPAYGPGYPVPNHPQATPAMILGLVGLIALPLTCVGGLVGIGGIVVGARVRREIDAAPGRWEGRSLATAGWVMGIIAVVGFTLAVVTFIILGVAGYLDS